MAEVRWLEVSLTVDSELAEAIAEVLARYVINGVVVERGVTYTDAEDTGTPYGLFRVYGYLPVDEKLEEERQRLSEALWHLGQIQPLPEPTFREIDDEDWMAAWKKHYQPIPIGKRLIVLPSWIEQVDFSRQAVHIDPSMAFGTGTHPSTQLCLEMVEKYIQVGKPVIDIGCGSGILSIAALKLGASHALGVDIDRFAVRDTEKHALRNGVADRMEAGLGSASEVYQGFFSIRHAPLVLANILAPAILQLLDNHLADLVESGGVLVLAGILIEQSSAIEDAASHHGLMLLERAQVGDWVAIVLKK